MNIEKDIDSINAVLQKKVSDSIKARAHFALASYWLLKDTARAWAHISSGYVLSKKYPYLRACYYSVLGAWYYSDEPEKSEAAYLKADQLLSGYPNREAYKNRSEALYRYAVLQQRKDDDEAFIGIVLNQSVPLAVKSGDSAILGSQYLGVGVGFMNIEQYKKAEDYINRAIAVLRNIHADPSRLIAAYNRAGENYFYLEEFDQIKRVSDTLKVLLSPYPESELYAGYYLLTGLYLHHKKAYKEAIENFDKGIKAAGGANKVYVIQEMLFAKIKSLIACHQYRDALKLLNSFLRDEEVMGFAGSRLEIFQGLYQSYLGLGQEKQAFQWLLKYADLNDSLYKSKTIENQSKLDVQFQTAEKEKQIDRLKAEKKEASLTAKTQRLNNWVLGIATVLLFFVAAFFIFYYRNTKKLAVQKEINYRQQLKEVQQQQELKITQAMLEGEERERQRVARDLHDGLGGMLAGVKINLSRQSEMEDQHLNDVIHQLDQSVSELRRIARNMMPESLLKIGLEAALRDLCESLSGNSTQIEFQAYNLDGNLPAATQATIYRIVQEILSNAVRHAAARKVILQCSQNGPVFYITAEDDGRGFDVAALKEAKGIGFINIRNRVDYLKGNMDIHSVPNEGTTINIELHVA
ncbi:hypothetical protein A8C56_14665 [Niabella ginsenosidivorans]|uniref:histidine kinase n=1 Tax=Niabella ginsenosidivorans TaxID=1176587 RepID=A0A1A9I351_9BACT|nr:hypothetical protein A8C56_14665 [Niabella ginsenosidivorans]